MCWTNPTKAVKPGRYVGDVNGRPRYITWKERAARYSSDTEVSVNFTLPPILKENTFFWSQVTNIIVERKLHTRQKQKKRMLQIGWYGRWMRPWVKNGFDSLLTFSQNFTISIMTIFLIIQKSDIYSIIKNLKFKFRHWQSRDFFVLFCCFTPVHLIILFNF